MEQYLYGVETLGKRIFRFPHRGEWRSRAEGNILALRI